MLPTAAGSAGSRMGRALTHTAHRCLVHASARVSTEQSFPVSIDVSPFRQGKVKHLLNVRRAAMVPAWEKRTTASLTDNKQGSAQQHPRSYTASNLLRGLLSTIMQPYTQKNPTAVTAMDLVRREEDGPIHFDHFAFRTFGVNGLGISSLSDVFLDFGYTQRDELVFPAKKLRAYWFAPPESDNDDLNQDGINGPLPRIFISELLVEQLSDDAQAIIRKYTDKAIGRAKYAAIASAVGALPWPTPTQSDYKRLASESEYAAWTLAHGYALNHTTVAVHHLKSRLHDIRYLNSFLQDNGFRLNLEGGVLKVSPDGRLLQSSTVADSSTFHFAEGSLENIPSSYIEFAERLPLPQFSHLPSDQIREHHRRDGFEVGNADKIFESTYVTAEK